MKKGFTLVELLVVITIMSILTVITVSQFQTAKRKANDVARKGDLNALAKSLQMYYADYGSFPESEHGMIRVVDNGVEKTVTWGGEFSDNASTPYIYMKKTPREEILDDNFPFCYVSDGGNRYGLFAMLENTADTECVMNNGAGAYSHCGGRRYCFAFVSPNVSVNDLDSLIP